MLLSAFLIFLANMKSFTESLPPSIPIPDMATLAYESRKGSKGKGSGVGIATWERYDYVAAK